MWEALKSWVVAILFLALAGGLVYWAFFSIETGGEHVANEAIHNLQKENETLKNQIKLLEQEVALYKPKEIAKIEEEPQKEEVPEVPEKTEPETYKHQTLIDELERLITDKVNMKVGSKGTRVGTVQKFLNIYNNTNNRIDNAYGETMKKTVAQFQKDVGLTADGNAGPSTYQKMIDWLKKQG